MDQLSDLERKAFEEKYLTTPRRHKAVAGSINFIELLNGYRIRKPTPVGIWAWLGNIFGRHNLTLQVALTSLFVVFAAGFFWLLVERSQLIRRSTVAEETLRQKEEELHRLTLNNENAKQERAALNQQREALNRDEELLRKREEELRAQEVRATGSGNGHVSFATFVLSSILRGEPGGRVLNIRRQDKAVHLIAYFDDENSAKYQASLQRISGEPVWSADLPRPRSELKRLVLVIPVSKFEDRDYIVKIEGFTPDGKRSALHEYPLPVKNANKP
jgi:hypothetical protein